MAILQTLALRCIALLIISHQHNVHAVLIDDNSVNSLIHKAKSTNEITAVQIYEEAIFVKNIIHIKVYNHFGELLMHSYSVRTQQSCFSEMLKKYGRFRA